MNYLNSNSLKKLIVNWQIKFQRLGYQRWLLIFIILGVVFRLIEYLSIRSVDLDEANIAYGISNFSFEDLMKKKHVLPYPFLFLVFEKLAISISRDNELCIRFFPFIFSLISLLLFIKIAKKIVSQRSFLIAAYLFAVCPHLIYYSAVLKQYSSDVAMTLLFYWGYLKFCSTKFENFHVFLFALIGCFIMWISYPLVFIIVGAGLSLMIFLWKERAWEKIWQLFIIHILWGINFIFYYFLSIRYVINYGTSSQGVIDYWKNTFLSLPDSFLGVIRHIFHFLGLSSRLVGIPVEPLGGLFLILGFSSMWLQKRNYFFLFFSPIIVTFIVSAMHKYPLEKRFLLFWIPALIIFMAEGINVIWKKAKETSPFLGIMLMGLVLIQPISLAYTLNSFFDEEIKPVMEYIKKHKQEGDIVYVYYGAAPAFKYYAKRYDFKEGDYLIGISARGENPKRYLQNLYQLTGNKRVWILWSHIYGHEDKILIFYLNNIGQRKDAVIGEGAAAFLYDLSETR